MERRDLELIEKYSINDAALDSLYKEHLNFEKLLEKYNKKPYLTPIEEMERKNIQKRKLLGKDKIEQILEEYRQRDSLS